MSKWKFCAPNLPCDSFSASLVNSTHLLIAGTTGAGKSVLLSNVIVSAMSRLTPSDIQFVFIDPKRTELKPFKGISSFCVGYGTTSFEACLLLETVSEIMENRYAINDMNNRRYWTGGQLVVVIDELADLMISEDAKKIKRLIQKITQLGRAAGVHVWAATQCPNRKIIPAEITLNFTDRVALRCVAAIESRQIVQVGGAEKLPLHGKGIYLSPNGLSDVTIPICTDLDIERVSSWWRNNPGERIA